MAEKNLLPLIVVMWILDVWLALTITFFQAWDTVGTTAFVVGTICLAGGTWAEYLDRKEKL